MDDRSSTERLGGASTKAGFETPSFSKYYLRQQPSTAAREGERMEGRGVRGGGGIPHSLSLFPPTLILSLSVGSTSGIRL